MQASVPIISVGRDDVAPLTAPKIEALVVLKPRQAIRPNPPSPQHTQVCSPRMEKKAIASDNSIRKDTGTIIPTSVEAAVLDTLARECVKDPDYNKVYHNKMCVAALVELYLYAYDEGVSAYTQEAVKLALAEIPNEFYSGVAKAFAKVLKESPLADDKASLARLEAMLPSGLWQQLHGHLKPGIASTEPLQLLLLAMNCSLCAPWYAVVCLWRTFCYSSHLAAKIDDNFRVKYFAVMKWPLVAVLLMGPQNISMFSTVRLVFEWSITVLPFVSMAIRFVMQPIFAFFLTNGTEMLEFYHNFMTMPLHGNMYGSIHGSDLTGMISGGTALVVLSLWPGASKIAAWSVLRENQIIRVAMMLPLLVPLATWLHELHAGSIMTTMPSLSTLAVMTAMPSLYTLGWALFFQCVLCLCSA